MVSVIIPIYNREKYIEECVRSIQAQTYQNYEIILIDDGSTDNSLTICHSLAQQYPNIRVLEGSHSGVSEARNLGLENTKGDFVFFVDSDDIIHPRLMESLVNGLKETGAAIAGTQCVNLLEKYWQKVYNYIEKSNHPGETTYQTFEQTMDAVFCADKSPLAAIGGVMMRRDLIGQTRFRPDLYIGEDFFFIYENMIKQCSTVFLKQNWYFARFHDHNSSWDFGYTGFMNRLLRRELVWKNEEKLGRRKYAAAQKNAMLYIYKSILSKNRMPSCDRRKAKQVLKSYGKTLFSDLSFRNKLRYVFYVWIPGGLSVLNAIESLGSKMVRALRKKQ